MELTGHIAADSLMTLEAYATFRKTHKAALMAHRQLRTVALGEHLRLQFESEMTMRYQIQEMLRIERIFEAADIQAEIDAYAPLVPDGRNWKATLLIAYPDAQQRQRALAQLMHVAEHVFVQVEGQPRVAAIADEDLDRETGEKTAAVHFLRFELNEAMVLALRAGAGVHLGCDHAHYAAQVQIAAETVRSLVDDLRV